MNEQQRQLKTLVGLVMGALICVFSFIVVIEYGIYGATLSLVDIVLLSMAYFISEPKYALAIGVGAMLGQIIWGTSYYAIGAFLIRMIEFWLVTQALRKFNSKSIRNTLPFLVGGFISFGGHLLMDWLVVGYNEYMYISVLYNVFQGIGSSIIVIMLIPVYELIVEVLPKPIEVNE